MELTLESLGLSQEELQERVIEKIVQYTLTRTDWCGEDDTEVTLPSSIKKQLDEKVKARIDKGLEEIAEKYIIPNAAQMIENITMQRTNEWGQAKKDEPPLTFIEYLIKRAEYYMNEPVDFFGKTKAQESYNWSAKTTRVSFLVDQYLHSSIKTAMEGALKNANSSIVGGLEKAVKIALQDVEKSLKVSVTTK